MKNWWKWGIGLLLVACTSAQIQESIGVLKGSVPLTEQEVANGLKQALEKGVDLGVTDLGVTDGFWGQPKFRIPFPPQASRVEEKLRAIGMGAQVDRFVETLNRGAEKAVADASPIFMKAIEEMTIQDAFDILKGEPDAATRYLEEKTRTDLIVAFRPTVEIALQTTQATKYYGDLVGIYNRIPLVQPVDPDLAGYATEKAVDGLFLKIEEEELAIRRDPAQRTTDLLKRVFGSLNDNQ
ncbi:MAG: DUF4197 domain-containing protein [Bacteroidota bacterium]|nr:DUF4197 domain-containing protein [Bacteroidota bacterium]MDX5449043.1 DUF4197 domain-containing protein [Bacteroidota bacterium]